MQFRSFHRFFLAAAFMASALAHAHDYKAGDLRIDHPYARPTVPNQPSGGAYITIENKGTASDKLVGIASPIAKAVEIHTMSMDGNIMRMREVPNIEFKPASKTTMRPGDGYHLMLIGLKQPLKTGDKFPMTLTFEKAGKVEISVWVEDKPAKDGGKEETAHHRH
ncbi:copper chaperone PCu(A)C [Noviherbaspirillum cavernae]|uniref:Copper chaperone PCu(A)C n=1 Tax=Noviherbaspirillum cavernae TaxID=2320862 RepID=A0A418WXY8_9BURK|nr:copper chaperone PCu(A)C [Noviherbaspirillum cavernae]RJG04955.1 copper chaperone PCu(A)C [Noviherbaspirillum cavernae]